MKYRANVAAILRRPSGEILICERLGVREAWQFPQGGIDDGESPEAAMLREVWEEIGVEATHLKVIARRGPYRYNFGDGRTKKGFHGKDQIYFLCDFSGNDAHIDVNTEHPEFSAFRWIAPRDFKLGWLPGMKREIYRTVLREFFNVKL